MAWTPVLPESARQAPAPAACTLMPLTHLAMVQASGADATAFLHSQLSNDVQGLPSQHSLVAGYCNAKGRLFTILRLWRHGDDWWLCLPADNAEAVVKRLRLFVLRSKVTLTPRQDLTLLGLAGNGAAKALGEAGLPAPEPPGAVATADDTAVLHMPGATPRFLLCLTDAKAPAAWAKLSECARPTETARWRLLDIDAGQATIGAATAEAFVPQQVNLERIDGISFRKGCYPGQEVVARMHYLGKPSRRMYRLQTTAPPPAPASAILDANQHEVGTVVDAQSAGDGSSRLLAVLQVAAIDAPLQLPDGTPLQKLDLPYPLETPDAAAT
ncbi:MAG: folate-binding protein YgfZ [Immundisolibacter sp.]